MCRSVIFRFFSIKDNYFRNTEMKENNPEFCKKTSELVFFYFKKFFRFGMIILMLGFKIILAVKNNEDQQT